MQKDRLEPIVEKNDEGTLDEPISTTIVSIAIII